ncbi:TIGR04255 family protein [Pseudomonas moraviensis]|uniref:TIGR04255 family protein n=1 Tax=Pseudomonas moraviensis TaxID=321662 RepID=UPI003D25EC3D
MPSLTRRDLPYDLSHAVERLSLGFSWETPLNPETMRELAALGPIVDSDLPRRFEVSTSEGEANFHQCGPETSGLPEGANLFALMFDDNADDDGPVDVKHTEIVINEDGMFFTVLGRYDGWEITRKRAKKLCDVFLKHTFLRTGLSAVEVRVNNLFFLDNFSSELSSLLNKGSDSLPGKIFSAKGYWHVNEGYYVEHADPDMSKLLVNLSVSKANIFNEEVLGVRTIHRFDTENTDLNYFDIDRIFEKFNHLHAVNKKLLKSLLSDTISDALDLFPKERNES